MRTPHVSLASMSIALALALTGYTPCTGAEKEKEARPDKGVARTALSQDTMAQTLEVSRRIDKLIEAGYARHNVKPNPLASDEVFLRRVYLDIVGRIPSHDEAVAFLDSADPAKRGKLIDRLLDSEGYVSNQFNYWADLLRLQSQMRYVPAQPYLDYVKDSIRNNKPYDQMVRELVTAEGYTWENGAAGYYLRDVGMPLDHMSNTIQVFLGTQLVCAQCHDHPFDSWTQMQYYKLAAFTYGVETRDRRNEKFLELRKMSRDSDLDQEVFRSANRILLPLAYRTNQTKRDLRLPHDYQYGDARPNDRVTAAALFGEDVKIEPGDNPVDIYARWMTSPTNPRFTNVIANRLWKRVMGVGLIEPVDDFKDGVNPSNPELMKLLTGQMVALKYDLKQYLRILYNTRTYQREATTDELPEEEPYHFPGPVLRRLSAEQLWDSMLTLTIPDVDERKGEVRDNGRYSNGPELAGMEMKEIMEMAREEAKRRQAQVKFQERTRDVQKQLRVAVRTGDQATAGKLQQEMARVRREIYGPEGERRIRQARQRVPETDPRWRGISRDLVRASELESPARPGHFLRMFGQSDREVIENASTEATVPQILTLLNGPIYGQLSSKNSVLSRNLEKAGTAEEKVEVLFVSILSRRPTPREKSLTLPRIQADGSRGIEDVTWALLNTRQLMFAQ